MTVVCARGEIVLHLKLREETENELETDGRSFNLLGSSLMIGLGFLLRIATKKC